MQQSRPVHATRVRQGQSSSAIWAGTPCGMPAARLIARKGHALLPPAGAAQILTGIASGPKRLSPNRMSTSHFILRVTAGKRVRLPKRRRRRCMSQSTLMAGRSRQPAHSHKWMSSQRKEQPPPRTTRLAPCWYPCGGSTAFGPAYRAVSPRRATGMQRQARPTTPFGGSAQTHPRLLPERALGIARKPLYPAPRNNAEA